MKPPGALSVAVLLAIVLTIPSLFGGLAFDDYVQQVGVRGHPSVAATPRPGYDLFSFMRGDPQERREIIDRIAGVWMVPAEFQVAFLRPLSSLTHAFDYSVWSTTPWLMHLQSVLWYGCLVWLVALLYRQVIGSGRAAGLAMLLYAVDDAHGVTVGWLSNRNALVAGVFGVLAMLLHDRWRRQRWRPGGWLAPASFAVALAGGESAVAVGGYMVAYEVCLGSGGARRKLRSLLPYGGILAAWWLLYSQLGYGAFGTDFYVDPGREPAKFLGAVAERLPVLLLSQLAFPPSDLWAVVSDQGQVILGLAGAGVVVVVIAALLPLLRRSSQARFFGLGAVLAAVPICATYPFDRLLIFVGIGAMGLVALFLAEVFGSAGEQTSWRLPARLLGGGWIVIHGLVAPITLPLRTLQPSRWDDISARASATLPSDPTAAGQRWIIVNAPDVGVSFYLMFRRAALGETMPAYIRFLSVSDKRVEVERTAPRSLTLRWQEGLLTRPLDRMLRGRRHRFQLGEKVELTGFTAEVTELTADGRAAEVRFTFSVPLEDPSLRWMTWVGRGYVPFDPPRLGEKRTLPLIRMADSVR
jgi:hypothetical protein